MRQCPTFCPCDVQQSQDFTVDGNDFVVRGDSASTEVRLHASADSGVVTLLIADHTGRQSVRLEQATFQALLDHINTTK